MKVTITTDKGPVEVDAEPVPHTRDLFAVHQQSPPFAEDDPGPWVLTHVPTGLALGRYARDADARSVGRQLYAAAPHACALADPEAVWRATPSDVREWVHYVRAAQPAPVASLESCAEYVAYTYRIVNGRAHAVSWEGPKRGKHKR